MKLPQSESLYVAWMRHREQEQHRHEAVVAQRQATADQSEASTVPVQEMAWAQRHAHERRLQASAIAQLRQH